MPCEVCASPIGSGIGGAATWQQHVADYNDPHRTMELVRAAIPSVSAGSAAPSSTDGFKPGDWFVDLSAGALWVCLPHGESSLQWRRAADVSSGAVDLSGYATVASLSGYATVASLSGYVRTADVAGYNFVTQSALSSALAPYATTGHVASAIAAGGFISQAAADKRYVLSGQSGTMNYVTRDQLAEALGSYLTSETASRTYLTETKADAADGFVRKNASLPYVTPSQLSSALVGYALTSSLSGFLTQTAADARYVRAGTGADATVTVSALNSALASYLRTADAPAELSLSSYLAVSAADAPDGFVRKRDFATAASGANLVTSSELAAALASRVTQADVASLVDAKADELAETFATKDDLADLAAGIAVQAGAGTVLAALELDNGSYRPATRSNNSVTLTGAEDTIPLLMPVRSKGVARDFILTVMFDRGTSMWAGSSFTVAPSTRASDVVQCSFFSATPGVLSVDTTGMDLDAQMVVFGFTEVADGRFLVTRKTVTALGS